MTTFTDFGLNEALTRALAEEKYITPTPIQAQTIPVAMTGRDVVGIAQTGTGKTAAFALPILHRLAANQTPTVRKQCRVLVLSPTRELSAQILASFTAYGRHLRLSATLAIGGVPMPRQVRALMNGVDVLVATPGRLLDLIKGNALRLDAVEVLVLDEADRMLDLGFINDIRKIVTKMPKQRQTLFFSATMPQAIAELAESMLKDPAKVAVTPVATTAERVEQRVIHVERSQKPHVLCDLLRTETVNRALVFTRTKHGADKVARVLVKAGIPADAIHGNKSQNYRERVLAAFRDGSVRTLIATDIAARGIDVEGVTHVINFDMPNEPESYVHRIGRTARAGATGVAISLCDGEERSYLRSIERLIRLPIPVAQRPASSSRIHEPDQADAAAALVASYHVGEERERPIGANPNRRRRRNGGANQPRQGQGQRSHGDQARGDQQANGGQRHGNGGKRPSHAGGHQGSGGANRNGSSSQRDGAQRSSAPREDRRPAHQAGEGGGDISAIKFLQPRGARPVAPQGPNR